MNQTRLRVPVLERPIALLDDGAMAAARAHLDRLTKPPASLGRLEELVVRLAGITGDVRAPLDRRTILVAAADHGVARHGVSAYPSSVTPQMVANFVAGGAAINALAAVSGAAVVVLDVGVAEPIPPVPASPRGGRLLGRRIADGTADMTRGPAMSRELMLEAVAAGATAVDELIAGGVDVLGLGDMGIGNTTAASALVAVLTGRPVAEVTGRGTGLDDAGQTRKVALIEAAIARNRPDPADPLGVLAAVGGLEIAALVGAVVAAASAGVPVILDGFITGAAALVAGRLRPEIVPHVVASHRSVEPGHAVALDALGLRPLLDLELRLGEGTGAALAIGLFASAVAMRDSMATFEGAGVDGPGNR